MATTEVWADLPAHKRERRMISPRNLPAYKAAGWETCPHHAPVGPGSTDDTYWADVRVVIRKTRVDATLPDVPRSPGIAKRPRATR